MNTLAKAIILGAIILLALVGFGIWYGISLRQQRISPTIKEAVFVCDQEKSIKATFYPDTDAKVDLELSDGRTLSVPRAVSASGARYANTDESFVFWNKGETAFITESGKTTYENCVIPGGQTPQVQTVSDGIITFTRPENFGLAVTPEQVLVNSYIPPCDPDFDYCLYYYDDTYKGTNFNSAGLKIKKRADLATSAACLSSPPEGFTAAPDNKITNNTYSTSIFRNVGQGAAGHYTFGSLYRLFIPSSNSCYEFETRIAQSQYENYPPGSIKEFTIQDQEQVNIQLMNIMEGITLPGGILFQPPE